MSAEFYNELAELGIELLTEFGIPVTTTRKTGGSKNPVTGDVIAEPTIEELEANGVLLEYEEQLIDGTNIRHGDKLLMLDNSFEPLQSDVLVHDGAKWQVASCKPTSPAGIPVVYMVQVRR